MDEQLLEKYLRNECSPAEAQQVLAFLATDDGQRLLQRVVDRETSSLKRMPLDPAEHAEAMRVFKRVQAAKRPALAPVRSTAWWAVRWAAAAVVLLTLGIGGWWLYQQSIEEPCVTLRTPYGQTRLITLPDQSVVTLNGNSSVTYPIRWTDDKPREVWVDGEAFFDVVHTKSHQQFVVHLPANMNVEVLGTRLNVYTRKSKTKVTLDTGRIRLLLDEQRKKQLVMKPGEMVVADTKGKTYYKRQVNAKALASWRDKKLVFEGMSLLEIAQMLEETYGVKVEIADPTLQKQQFSGSIPNQNIDTILKGLSTLFDFHITRQSNRIVIQ